jgi:hypothetical protein
MVAAAVHVPQQQVQVGSERGADDDTRSPPASQVGLVTRRQDVNGQSGDAVAERRGQL